MHQGVNISDQKNQCIYCSASLKDAEWHSHFDSSRLYKVCSCDCGRSLAIPMAFHGSGHDNWDQKASWTKRKGVVVPASRDRIIPLEARLTVVKEFSHHP